MIKSKMVSSDRKSNKCQVITPNSLSADHGLGLHVLSSIVLLNLLLRALFPLALLDAFSRFLLHVLLSLSPLPFNENREEPPQVKFWP